MRLYVEREEGSIEIEADNYVEVIILWNMLQNGNKD